MFVELSFLAIFSELFARFDVLLAPFFQLNYMLVVKLSPCMCVCVGLCVGVRFCVFLYFAFSLRFLSLVVPNFLVFFSKQRIGDSVV